MLMFNEPISHKMSFEMFRIMFNELVYRFRGHICGTVKFIYFYVLFIGCLLAVFAA